MVPGEDVGRRMEVGELAEELVAVALDRGRVPVVVTVDAAVAAAPVGVLLVAKEAGDMVVGEDRVGAEKRIDVGLGDQRVVLAVDEEIEVVHPLGHDRAVGEGEAPRVLGGVADDVLDVRTRGPAVPRC